MAIDAFYLTSDGKKLTPDLQKKVGAALSEELNALDAAQ